MRIFRDLDNLPRFKKAVITIGSFDGVHRGHQKIVQKVRQTAAEIGGESIIITFHPHPREIIYPKDNSLRLINTVDEKIKLFEKYGVDNVVVVPFTVEFAQQSADEYIHKFLIEKFHPATIVIGYDHRFGLNRQGNFDFLQYHAAAGGYNLVEIEKQTIKDLSISSTKIRAAIDEGNVAKASQLLGHHFILSGIVVHGEKTGTKIGYPTANVHVSQATKIRPPIGIYAVYVWYKHKRYGGMLYIGNRPTIATKGETSIEVNIFDFDENLYEQEILIELIDFIRHDVKFDGLAALKRQLGEDKVSSLRCLADLEKKNKPKSSVVILNYNTKKHLQAFLPNVIANVSAATQVVVADNASQDESVAFLAKDYPQIEQIVFTENHGFAEGYNLALQQVETDYYVILNSDIETTPNWLDPIIEHLEQHPKIAACQPKILSFQEKANFEHAGAAGGWLDRLAYPFCRGRVLHKIEKDEGQYNDSQEVFWASGAAFVIRAKLFHEIGGFDKDYFAHFEEIDLCWRLKRAGYGIAVIPAATVYHVGGGTLAYESPFKAYLNFRNSLYTIFKNEPSQRLFRLIFTRLILDGLAGGLFLTQGKIAHIGMIIKAHFKFYSQIPNLIRKKKHYNKLIQQVSIGKENTKGRFNGSIIWHFYAKKKQYFSQLIQK